MSNLKLKRITLNGSITKIEFNHACCKWLVKNFTAGDIYVGFDEYFLDSEAIKIAKNMGQVIVQNEKYEWADNYNSHEIYVKGTGEVEVQQLCYE